ncbi:MAG: DNA primase [Candidatus Gracilibacteria bacterium]|nr:DNA primase [Candidatus Gracilibacteria bacterium]MDD5178929.1 DNA primase [Candidatus Gracilibacteria bacterium]
MDPVAEIKSRLSIVDVVSQYTQLKKAGRNFKACCPFHNEKTPSFIVSPDRQFAWCYGCQTGGDIFKIVELLEGVDFKEALKILADKAGVELPTNFSGGAKKEQRDKLVEINEAAADYFIAELAKSKEAQKYLAGRNLKAETIEEWKIGFAPNGYANLFPKLLEKGFSKKDLVEASIAGVKEFASDELFDKFHNRITFPIRDHRGSIVGFTARILSDGEPKYLNSSESPVFQKGAILFGFSQAREAIREKKFAVIVEGQLDVISCHQAGFRNVVASSGTALTSYHLTAVKNLVESVVFCFDADKAGIESTRRALELAAAMDINAKVVILPDGFKDPDEAIQKDPQIFADAVASAVTPLEFFFMRVYAEANFSEAATKKKVARELLSYAAQIASAVEREDFIHRLSLKIGVSEAALAEELAGLKITSPVIAKEEEKLAAPEKFRIRDLLTGMVLAFSEISETLSSELSQVGLAEITVTENEEKLALLASDKYADFSDAKIREEMLALISQLNFKSTKDRKQELKLAMQQAEEAGDEEKAAQLYEEYQQLLNQ